MAKKTKISFEDFDPSELTYWEDLIPYNFEIQESEGDDQTTCPVSIDKLQDYAKLEFDLPRKVKLAFVRTANMNGFVFWLWKFRSGGVPFFLTVVRDPDGLISYGSDDAYTMTPEQYLVCDYYINGDFPCPAQTRDEFKKKRDPQKNDSQLVLETKDDSTKDADKDSNLSEQDYLSFPKVDVLKLETSFSEEVIENEEELTPGSQWIFTVDSFAVKFRWCPPGEFMMGTSPERPYFRLIELHEDESYHQVVLTKGFWINEVPVTQKLFSLLMGYNPSSEKGERHPVNRVSWNMSQVFLEQISKLAPHGRIFVLPTEAQWEYACRAGTTTHFNVGDELKKGDDVFDQKEMADVGLGKPNCWGILNMHGCICEWCSDWYKRKYLLKKIDPTGPKSGDLKVFRGGGWTTIASGCRSSSRGNFWPNEALPAFGFRFIMVHKEDVK